MDKVEMTSSLVKKLKNLKSEIIKFDVKHLALFGSYARSEQRLASEVNWMEDSGPSDIDLFAIFDDFTYQKREGLRAFLTTHFEEEIDIAVLGHILQDYIEGVNNGVQKDGIVIF